MRMLNQSLELRTTNPSKTPFFDTLTSTSLGYGGEPISVSYLNLSKGKCTTLREASGAIETISITTCWRTRCFRRRPRRLRPWFRSRLTASVQHCAAQHGCAVSRCCRFRASAFALGSTTTPTRDRPTSTLHGGGDVQLSQWFRNALDTYTGGVDFKLAKRTTLSYDQFCRCTEATPPSNWRQRRLRFRMERRFRWESMSSRGRR